MQDQEPTDATIIVPTEEVQVELTAEQLRAAAYQLPAEELEALAEAAAEREAAEAMAAVTEASEDAGEIQDELVEGAEDLAGEGSALADLIDADRFREWGTEALLWVRTDVLTVNAAIQLALVFGAIIPAIIFGPRLKAFIGRYLRRLMPAGILRRVADATATLATPIAAWLTLSVFMGVLAGAMNQADGFLSAAQSLLAAWIVVRIVTLAIRSEFWSKVAFFVAWPIAAMDAFGVLGDVFDWMRARSFELVPADPALGIEAQTFSMYDVLRAALIFAVFLVLANFLVGLIVSRVNQTDELNASFKALVAKVLGFVVPIVALLMALAVIGFDLGSLAIFGGAAALGIGLGLQKIIGNFLAGFTLLADRSIKPGDVIQVGDTFGWITDMKSRYVSIRTRDGTEHLIPNATFMDEGVVNWSHSDGAVRCVVAVGVSYDTKSMQQVRDICLAAVKDTPRVLVTPAPVVNMVGFGESSVDFHIRFWINDPPNGIENVKSEVLMRVWDGLAEAKIEIPFPQRDLHIRSSEVSFAAQDYREAAE